MTWAPLPPPTPTAVAATLPTLDAERAREQRRRLLLGAAALVAAGAAWAAPFLLRDHPAGWSCGESEPAGHAAAVAGYQAPLVPLSLALVALLVGVVLWAARQRAALTGARWPGGGRLALLGLSAAWALALVATELWSRHGRLPDGIASLATGQYLVALVASAYLVVPALLVVLLALVLLGARSAQRSRAVIRAWSALEAIAWLIGWLGLPAGIALVALATSGPWLC